MIAPLVEVPEIVAFDLVEVREGDGDLVAVASSPGSPQKFQRSRLHGGFSVVHEQNHVDIRKAFRDARRDAGRLPRGVPQSFSIYQDQLPCVIPERCDGRLERASHPDPVYQRRQQPTELLVVIACEPSHMLQERFAIGLAGCTTLRATPTRSRIVPR